MMIRYVPWKGWRVLFRISNPMQPSSSSAPATVGLRLTPCSESTTKVVGTSVDVSSTVVSAPEDQTHDTSTSESKAVHVVNERKSSIVAAAFASLKRVEVPQKSTQSLHESISAADSVESLLSIAESPLVSRRHALQIVSQLADWTASGHAKLSDFETDTRFIKLCRLLGRGLPHGSPRLWKEASGNGDLAVVLGVTGEDKAAKLVAGISLSQMIRIMSSLAQKQRRSTPLLRSLAFNLARQTEKFNIKDCADLLYAMATLNFPDDLLLEKTCGDLCECVESNHRPAVIGSILTSLGLLRYKNTEVLDALADWVVCHVDVCRPHDLTALLLTLATVFHTPSNADHLCNVILPHVTVQDLPSPSAWLDVVWSLVVLEQAATQHVASVLDPNFCIKLSVDTDGKMRMNVASKLKLLNINAAAQLKIPALTRPLQVFENSLGTFLHFVFKNVELGRKLTKFWDRFCSQMQSLSIDSCDISEKTFVDILLKCSHLETLDVRGCYKLLKSGRVLEKKFDVILLSNTLVKLRELRLDPNSYLSDALFNKFMAIASNLEDVIDRMSDLFQF